MRNRWRVSIGFVIIAGLIGIGVVPVRKGLTVRFQGATGGRSSPSRAPKRRSSRRSRPARWLARLVGRR